MYSAKFVWCEQASEEIKEEYGIDKYDYCTFLFITTDEGEEVYSDSVEPEDATFGRGFSWVAGELERAYEQGRKDALKGSQVNPLKKPEPNE